jgi:hypothetical protein
MIRIRHVIVGLIIALGASACTQRMICPAYQSAFIHDKATLDRKFSYFGEDSLPKILEASKSKHLLIDPMTYRRKLRSLRTVAMMDIYPQKPDSLEFNDEFSLAERDIEENPTIDSTAAASISDSIYVISIKKEKFNIDQELYLWYMREQLVYPDVRLIVEQNKEEQKLEKKKAKKGFFKRLFGKKNKSDSTNFDIETSATASDDTGKKKKKDKKKKNKKEKTSKLEQNEAVDPSKDPPPVEEEDDGEEDF